ncbi:MAG: sugar ABC transporter substrate-binding protein [Verrucomicrobia bacterium]|nr:sugar ABC transporter substrate-binding protein [Verrucomicrobiota bacterium]MBV9274011.1 sugar ABC transporter substrate-binding protein [Verrucomicrobiota bacterium]
MKRVLTVITVLVLSSFLTAESFAKKLTVILLANASTQNVIQGILQEYHQQHPDIDFQVSILPANGLLAKLNTLVTAGDYPDIVELTTAMIQTYADSALDLGSLTDPKALLGQYLPAYQPFMISGQKIIGIPIEATINGLFYNKALFAKAGVTVPQNANEIWTWEQFKEAVAKVNKLPECRMGVAFDCTPQRWSNLLYQAGGRWISANGDSFLPDAQPAVDALNFFRGLVQARLIPTSSWPGKTDGGQLFKTGVAAMLWSGNWQLRTFVSGGMPFPFGTTYFPKGAMRAACPGGEFFLAFDRAQNRDDAGKLLLWWSQPSITKHYLDKLGGSLLSPMTNLPMDYGKYTEYQKPMLADLGATPSWVSEDLARPALNLLQDDLLNELILCGTGRISAQQAVLDMRNLGNAELQRERRGSR